MSATLPKKLPSPSHSHNLNQHPAAVEEPGPPSGAGGDQHTERQLAVELHQQVVSTALAVKIFSLFLQIFSGVAAGEYHGSRKLDAAQTLHVPAECGSLELLWPWWVGGANVRNFSCHHKYFRLRSESPALCLESFGQG